MPDGLHGIELTAARLMEWKSFCQHVGHSRKCLQKTKDPQKYKKVDKLFTKIPTDRVQRKDSNQMQFPLYYPKLQRKNLHYLMFLIYG